MPTVRPGVVVGSHGSTGAAPQGKAPSGAAKLRKKKAAKKTGILAWLFGAAKAPAAPAFRSVGVKTPTYRGAVRSLSTGTRPTPRMQPASGSTSEDRRRLADLAARARKAAAEGRLVNVMPLLPYGTAAQQDTSSQDDSDQGYTDQSYDSSGGGDDGTDASWGGSDWGAQVESEDAEGGGAPAEEEATEELAPEEYYTEDGLVPEPAPTAGLIDTVTDWVKVHPILSIGIVAGAWYAYDQYKKNEEK